MTLNDLEWPFCVKICFGIDIYNGLTFWLSDKTLLKFADVTCAYIVSVKNVAQGL